MTIWLSRKAHSGRGTATAKTTQQEHAWRFEELQGSLCGWSRVKKGERGHRGPGHGGSGIPFRDFDFYSEGTGKSQWGVLSLAVMWSALWFKGSLTSWVENELWEDKGKAGRIGRRLLQ